MLSVAALLVLVAVWALISSGGGGEKKTEGGSNGRHPTSSITPGPSSTGPAISQRPGGRDESGGGNGSGSSGSGDSGGTGAGSGGSDEGANGGGGGGLLANQLPAGSGSSLPDCTASAVQLTVRSLRNTYAPGDTPTVQLIAKNTTGSDCKVDLGPKNAVLAITQAGGGNVIWSSADCPSGSGSVLFRVPANEQVTYTVKWDRKPSAANCATPAAGSATAGTYLVEVVPAGFPKAQASFVLSSD